MRKGQAAMEFLMTYGWAILIVLAAIGALAYFGVLSPSRFLPSSCQMPVGFGCVEYRATNDEIQFTLKNNLGKDLSKVNLYITGDMAKGVTGGNSVSMDSHENFIETVVVGISIFYESPANAVFKNGQEIGTVIAQEANAWKGSTTTYVKITYRKGGEEFEHEGEGILKLKVE